MGEPTMKLFPSSLSVHCYVRVTNASAAGAKFCSNPFDVRVDKNGECTGKRATQARGRKTKTRPG